MNAEFNAEAARMLFHKSIKKYYNPQEIAEILVNSLSEFDIQVRAHHDENEQWFLDYQDNINEISVK